MALFRRKKDPYRAADPRDRKLLATLASHGAHLDHARHVLHYVYFPDESSAREACAALGPSGWIGVVRRPLKGSTEWSVVCERSDYALLPDNVIADRALFEGLAAAHHGTYDGWEASV